MVPPFLLLLLPAKPFELGRRQGMLGMLVLCGQPG